MRSGHRSPTWNFVQHLLEMVVAMFAGMLVLGMPADMLFEAVGWQALTELTVPSTLLMATYMNVGMAAWMRFRGCGWPAIAEMCVAMYASFAVLYPFYWAGLVDGMAVMMVGHVLMVPAMVVAMLFRRDEYSRGHHAHKQAAEPREPVAQREG